jgi:exodeoxyribonuclease VII large subunit
MNKMANERHIYTISELTRRIKLLLEENIARIWVEGEISGVSPISTGTVFFTLKDAQAQLKCVLFANIAMGLKFKLKAGLKVVCSGKISVFERDGRYQFYPEILEPRGVGALQLAFEQLKERLAGEGLFEQKHKKPLPFLPQRIGIVTSPTGAAIRDVLKVLKRRFANLAIIVNPVRVQGEAAGPEIARAIDEFNHYGKVDVLIVTRGGGSLEDLWAFNEECVARAIYRSRIPVISAVGHEIDYTISDFAADFRAPTPSAAAEQVIARKQELLERIDNFYSRARGALLNKIELCRHKLSGLKAQYVFREPADLIQQYRQRIDELTAALDLEVRHLAEVPLQRYKVLIGKLQALSPLNILSRGYSISLLLPEKKTLKRAGILKPGLKVETRLAEGAFVSRIEKILDTDTHG